MKSLKRFSKRQKIVALSLCALSLCALVVILGVVVLINTSVYRQLDEANVNVIFSRDIFGGLFGGQSMTFPPKAIKQIYDSPEIVQVPSNFNQWELLLKVAAQMSPSGDYNIFDASYSRIDDASFLELLNNNALIHVKELKLVNCSKLSDESIGQICQMTNLRRMNLSSVNCSDESLTKLSSLPSLKRITIAKTQVTGECFNSEGWDALEILNLDFCPISKNLFVYLAKLPRLGILSVPYYEGIVEDLEELAARSNIEFIRINTFGLPKEEADRLALQYADYPKIALGPTDYGYIEEQQQWMDEHTSEPWFEPGSHIHMLFAPSE